jgi:hypothetical protein
VLAREEQAERSRRPRAAHAHRCGVKGAARVAERLLQLWQVVAQAYPALEREREPRVVDARACLADDKPACLVVERPCAARCRQLEARPVVGFERDERERMRERGFEPGGEAVRDLVCE